MQKNVGSTDKVIRWIIGLILLSLLFFLEGGVRYIGLIGLIPILTAIFGFCPLYTLFKLNTNKQE
ncbi:MAG: DUF2892 domain-containing protein [Bacilli bacterium]|nr:DUF2892 domain-containing protein [Bacilli bacterium]